MLFYLKDSQVPVNIPMLGEVWVGSVVQKTIKTNRDIELYLLYRLLTMSLDSKKGLMRRSMTRRTGSGSQQQTSDNPSSHG